MKEENGIKQYLTAIAMLSRQGRLKGYHYNSQAEFILKHGTDFQCEFRCADLLGIKKQCFRNAAMMAFDDERLVYVEGYACHIIPVEHAWCYDPEKNLVVETTWDTPGGAYFGVPFLTRFLSETLLKNGYSGLIDDWRHGFPLLKRKTGRGWLWRPGKDKL